MLWLYSPKSMIWIFFKKYFDGHQYILKLICAYLKMKDAVKLVFGKTEREISRGRVWQNESWKQSVFKYKII